jgi:transposase
MQKVDACSISLSTLEHLRQLAVKRVLAGKKQKVVAKELGVTPQTICVWIKAYRLQGREALKSKRKGRPLGGKLKLLQAAQIVRTVIDHYPEQLQLPFCLWSGEAVTLLIKRRFGLQLSVWTIGRYLKRWGFTPEKPVVRAWEQNPEQVQQWLEKEYHSIRLKAQREKARIYWSDEIKVRSDHSLGCCYGLEGQNPGQRLAYNMIFAVSNRGHLKFMFFKERFTTKIFLEFLGRLLGETLHPVHLIIDRHTVHRSLKVKTWVKENEERIRLFFLPR